MKRFAHINADSLQGVSEGRRKQVEKLKRLIRDEPGIRLTIRNASLADHYLALALAGYALGEALPGVADNFRQAALPYLRVLQHRGTDPGPEAGSQGRDYSLGNSVETDKLCAAALLGGDVGSAELMTRQIWDPDNADYFGWRSDVPTPNQQAIACGFRCLMAECWMSTQGGR
jgi:hypothetical protein